MTGIEMSTPGVLSRSVPQRQQHTQLKHTATRLVLPCFAFTIIKLTLNMFIELFTSCVCAYGMLLPHAVYSQACYLFIALCV